MNDGPVDIKLITTTEKHGRIKVPAKIQVVNGRIEFLKAPFTLKDEIKAMKGAKWHGFDEKPRRVWSIQDCFRNHFQLQCMMGQNPYEWFDKPLKHDWKYDRPLREHQVNLADFGLTYHYQIWAAEMGVGKTLAAIEVMEQSGKKNWWWVGPKKSLDASIKREFNKWNLSSLINVEMMSYEMMAKRMKMWADGLNPPDGVIFDESSRLKSNHSQRTQAAQALADGIRDEYGYGGYVILMSGTPSPKSPIDWWAQAEIAWPGFLREGSPAAFEQRLAHMVLQDFPSGSFMKRIGWKDDEHKCEDCGAYADAPQHDRILCATPKEYHDFVPGRNEVAYLEERLTGLVVIKHKKDCLDLPEKQYRIVDCEPNATTLRVAKVLFENAPSVITGLTLLRELSDGFQYREQVDGTTKCPVCKDGTTEVWVDPADDEKVFQMIDMLDDEYVETLIKQTVTCPTCKGKQEIPRKVRVTREVPTPKEAALVDLLDENEEQGRIVIFAGFIGSLDRIIKVCHKIGWHTVRCDGVGWRVEDDKGNKIDSKVDPLDYWVDLNNARVAFVAHPQSGGLSMTLTEARMSVFWSNDFNPESRSQAEDRIHRIGMDKNKGATIVDLIHLPTDMNIREVLRDNRRLELLTLGEVQSALGISA